MPANLTSASPDHTTVLSQAVAAFRTGRFLAARDRPSAAAVVEALLEAEKVAKRQRLVYPFTSLLGCWRLCFATGTRKARQRGGINLGKGFYMPKLVPAHISFNASDTSLAEGLGRGEIGNQLQSGPVQLKFTGPARYLGKKNLLAFDFTQLQIKVLNRSIYHTTIRGGEAKAATFDERSIAELPFFAFFFVTDDFIAARGRGGGLAIWIRETNELVPIT
jgi:hypothetical protein